MTDSQYTHLSLILDRSGSMSNIAKDMNGGIHELLKEQAALPGEILVDVTTFDTTVDQVVSDELPGHVPADLIKPRGGTALLDAIGETVTKLGEKLAAKPEDKRPGKVVVVIVTDGQENSSVDWKSPAIKELVEKQTNEFAWEFLFLGANIDSFDVGGGLGYAATRTMNYAPTAAGVNGMTRSVSSYLSDTRSGLDATLVDSQ